MAVRCEGDLWIMEQLGERQDFESELSRLGMRHEDFHLHVRKAAFNQAKKTWSSNYAIRVTHSMTGRRSIYWGGPGQDWVAQFVADLRNGLYGDLLIPRERRSTNHRAQAPRRSAS
jgi:hypothetical protein